MPRMTVRHNRQETSCFFSMMSWKRTMMIESDTECHWWWSTLLQIYAWRLSPAFWAEGIIQAVTLACLLLGWIQSSMLLPFPAAYFLQLVLRKSSCSCSCIFHEFMPRFSVSSEECGSQWDGSAHSVSYILKDNTITRRRQNKSQTVLVLSWTVKTTVCDLQMTVCDENSR